MESSVSPKAKKEIREPEDDKVLSICIICGETFPMISLLHAHVHAKHNVDTLKNVSAPDRGLASPSAAHTSAHSEACAKHVCPNCDADFIRKADLKDHIITVHRNLKTHICNQCRKGFTTPSYLRLHVLTVHEGVKAYSCPHCCKRYTQKHSLKKHISSRHGSELAKTAVTPKSGSHQLAAGISPSPVRVITGTDANQVVAQCNV